VEGGKCIPDDFSVCVFPIGKISLKCSCQIIENGNALEEVSASVRESQNKRQKLQRPSKN
jgi:hypothetical protein